VKHHINPPVLYPNFGETQIVRETNLLVIYSDCAFKLDGSGDQIKTFASITTQQKDKLASWSLIITTKDEVEQIGSHFCVFHKHCCGEKFDKLVL
jgi:hypothetical protein